MDKYHFEIKGKVVDRSGSGVADVRVEAWLKTVNPNQRLAHAPTAKGGRFSLRIRKADLARITERGKLAPVVYFKVLDDARLRANTRGRVEWNEEKGKETVTIEVLDSTEELLQRLTPSLRKEIESLRAYEDRIVSALEDGETRDVFLKNPAVVLNQLELPLSATLKKRLKNGTGGEALSRVRRFRLPTGQVITPRVRVRFTR